MTTITRGHNQESGHLLESTIACQDIRTCFQPIVFLRNGKVLGYEALSRGPIGTQWEEPRMMFAAAARDGLSWELDAVCRLLALQRFAEFHSDKLLFLNVNPHVIADPRFREYMTPAQLANYFISPGQLVFELTEETAVTNYIEYCDLLDYYKQQGFRLAVDDAGAGYSGLNMICTMKPSFVKMDMALIRDIHRDSFRQHLLRMTVEFAHATETTLVAEGIESEAELLTLLDLGVEYGQGFSSVPRSRTYICPRRKSSSACSVNNNSGCSGACAM